MSPHVALMTTDVTQLFWLQVAAQAAERAVLQQQLQAAQAPAAAESERLQQQLRAAELQRDRLSGVLQRVAATEGDVEAAIARLDSMVRPGCIQAQ